VRLGRSRDNDLVLPPRDPPLASGYHAEIRYERGTWVIVDRGSRNGTFVNGRRIQRCALRAGDRVTVGADSLEVVAAPGQSGRWARAVVAAALLVALASAVALAILTRPPSLETIAARLARSVYLVASDAGGSRRALGTAFAVDARGWLATNAHIAAALPPPDAVMNNAAAPAVAILSDSGGRSRPIVEVRIHPAWRPGTIENDVALLRLAPGEPIAVVRLADDRILNRLRRGVSLAALGFVAAGTDLTNPRGRLSVDVLGDVRAGRYLEVGLHIAPGTSGSPVFTRDGTVVAIVAAGDFVDIPGSAQRVPAASGVNWAIAVSALRELLATLP